MFAVIYQSWVLPEHEENYQQLWQKIADYFISECGAIGACLHKTQEGSYLAYSRWPDRATREASWPGDTDPFQSLPITIAQAITDIKTYIDESRHIPEITMDVTCDLLLPQ